MENRNFYNEILTEHNMHPDFKHDIEDADIVLDGINPSCGDEIQLKLKTDGDIITDGAFVGDGCAISQASTDIMLGMIIGQSKERALEYADIFMRMIRGEASDEEIDSLEEASALRDISHMPARVRCAMLGWRTLSEALKDK
ncbi:NifU-like protein [uncultured Ruminococcus sp.]|jgi:nitrogen fixation NifU-like protein|uniref:SUF system NifU family Fe-S cluster assembly protein n=2 Tax=Oscillospiraceae TaxID=216572 RepID=A0AAE3IH80_9FIRM|nr:SUF system NifU family Fe-S cluster assembly protein [Hominimerdicola aceti]MCU6705805.1 SUF system NifU family Fe-S cluster assembly protein [Hominimerdicola aceti]SCI76754.1 NifU-like protein [uncultured Ruminococcus sp.]